MITDKGTCRVNGEIVTTCENHPIYSWSDCEAACTTHEPCVGYYHFGLADFCYLIPSTHSCPTGYSLVIGSVTAATSNDLEAGDLTGEDVCYGKNLGNINLFKIFQFNAP